MSVGRALRAVAMAAIVAGCATPDAADEPKHVSGFALEPFAVHEECAKLAAGDRVEYAFTSDLPVDFNIHYHDGSAVIEPIVRDRVNGDAEVFMAVLAQDYCLMWEAGAAGSHLDYRIRIRRSDR